MPIFVTFSAWRAGRNEPVQFGRESAHKSRASSGSTTLGDCMRSGQHIQGGEHHRGVGEASYCGLCQESKEDATPAAAPQHCPVRREVQIAGSMPVAKRFAPSIPQRGNTIFHHWHPKNNQRLSPEGQLGRPSAKRRRGGSPARQLQTRLQGQEEDVGERVTAALLKPSPLSFPFETSNFQIFNFFSSLSILIFFLYHAVTYLIPIRLTRNIMSYSLDRQQNVFQCFFLM